MTIMVEPCKNEIKCKIIAVGDIAVGKTSLIQRFCNRSYNEYQDITVNLDILTRSIHIGDKKVTMTIWDTVGQEKFFSLAKGIFRCSRVVLFVYDVTRQTTLFNVYKWIKFVEEEAPSDIIKVLIGHKCDGYRQVSTEEGQMVANYYKMPFFEASAKNNINLDDIFYLIANKIVIQSNINNLSVHQSDSITLKNNTNNSNSFCSWLNILSWQ